MGWERGYLFGVEIAGVDVGRVVERTREEGVVVMVGEKGDFGGQGDVEGVCEGESELLCA